MMEEEEEGGGGSPRPSSVGRSVCHTPKCNPGRVGFGLKASRADVLSAC